MPGVGLLTAAVGFGGLVGSAAGAALIGRDRLAPDVRHRARRVGHSASASWASRRSPALALVALAVGGVGRVLIDVAGTTLLQRTVPNAMRAPVLGIQEGIVTAALALGSVGASVVIDTAGVAVGLRLRPGSSSAWRHSCSDRPSVAPMRRPWCPSSESALLRGVPMFEPLPMTTIEDLASGLGWSDGRARPADRRQRGEPGHCFYVVDQGEVLVQVDRTSRRPAPRAGRGVRRDRAPA